KTEDAYGELRTRSLETAHKLAAQGRMSELERLRDQVKTQDRALGGQRPGEIAALLATIDLEGGAGASALATREQWEKRAPVFRKYRRTTNAAFKVFDDETLALEQIKTMTGPSLTAIGALRKRLASAKQN